MSRIILLALLGAVIYFLFHHYASFFLAHKPLIVLALLLCFGLLRKFILEFGVNIYDAANRSVYEEWQGRYYTFNGQQIRFYLEDDRVWIPEKDVQSILQPVPEPRELRQLEQDYGVIPGQKIKGYTEAGLLRMCHVRTANRHATHSLIRFKFWLEKEALPNVKRLPSSSAAPSVTIEDGEP